MPIYQRSFITAVVLSFVLTLPACKPQSYNGASTPSAISLTAGPDGFCLQNGVEGGSVVMGTAGVTWSSPIANTSIEVHFPAGCGFANGCDFGPSNTPIQSGTSSISSGRAITYTNPGGIKIGGSACDVGSGGVGTAGIIMR